MQGARGRGVTLMGARPVPRCHVITQFNRGIYDYIVATDEELPAVPAEQPPRKKRKGAAPRWVPPRSLGATEVSRVPPRSHRCHHCPTGATVSPGPRPTVARASGPEPQGCFYPGWPCPC